MLDTLLEAELNGGQIDEAGIREEVDTFMFEGYDTTSAGILFCLFMIATHEDIQQQIFEEISEIIGKLLIWYLKCSRIKIWFQGIDGRDDSDLGIHEYNDMKLLDRVMKESLRLYPPVPYISRQIKEPADLGIYTYKKNSWKNLINLFAICRNRHITSWYSGSSFHLQFTSWSRTIPRSRQIWRWSVFARKQW